MTLSIVWSDYCVYLLFIFIAVIVVWSLKHPESRQKCYQLCLRPLTVIAILILTSYAIIGFLDSIHFEKPLKDGGGIVSVLDIMLSPMLEHNEVTYSAPFAVIGYSKENMTDSDGKVTRDFKRLEHAGSHLSHQDERLGDILNGLMQISIQTIIIWFAFVLISIGVLSTKHQLSAESMIGCIISGETKLPWRTLFLTLGGLLFIILFIRHFMHYYHILGTDQVGQDVLYQSLKSIRTGLIIGTFTTLLMLPFAISLGLIAGYFSGWVDDVVQFVYTLLSAIPAVLLIAAAVLSLQIIMDRQLDWFDSLNTRADARLLALCAILGLTSWTILCRYLRGEAMKIRHMDYVQAARSLGVSHLSILRRHLLPNVMHIVLITIALDFSGLVLAEAVLSYVGVGVDPSTFSWGMMINSARMELARVPVIWWSLLSAFIFMFVLVLSANIFSDAIRNVLDPHRTKGIV